MTAETCKHYKHTSYDVQSLLLVQYPRIPRSLLFDLHSSKKQNKTWFFVYTAQCMKGELPAKTGLLSTRTKGNKSKEQCKNQQKCRAVQNQQKWLIFRNACFSKHCKNCELDGRFPIWRSSVNDWRHMKKLNSVIRNLTLCCSTLSVLLFFYRTSFASELAS